MACHVSTCTGGSPVTATMVLTVWSRDHGDRIPIRGALPRRWRSGSSRYAASSPVKASITGCRRSAGISNRSISRYRLPQRAVGSWCSWAGYSRTKEAAQKLLPAAEADQPNECSQSDFTHWQLADGAGVEIINWLDDHSRYLLAAIARPRQVDHQTEQGGSVSGTGFAGDASPSRRQRRHGDLLPQPDPSGLDSPITGRWSPNAPSSPSTATCGG
jgi:hypothetical protein